MISGERLTWSYGETPVLAGVDLATRPSRVLGLIGPNGTGKTTLLRLLYGALTSPTGGVRVDGQPLAAMSARDVARRLAVVVQEAGSETTASRRRRCAGWAPRTWATVPSAPCPAASGSGS